MHMAKHTVQIGGTKDRPTVEFRCHGDRTARCHNFPDCECETWELQEHRHPEVPHEHCWMRDWFTSGAVTPQGGEYHDLADAGYVVGMEGEIETEFEDEYIVWWFKDEQAAAAAVSS